YAIRPNGEVVLTRATSGDGDDPALMPFLGFLARDMAEHPERLQAVDAGLAQRIQALVGGVEVDLEAPCRWTMNERGPVGRLRLGPLRSPDLSRPS
ncbi:MAG: type II toxin-antitoxin system PrlF family antitoxin, partial [Casimicrobiaceae bacterium]